MKPPGAAWWLTDMRRAVLLAAVSVATLMTHPHEAGAACQVTVGGSVDCDAATKTTSTTNANGTAPVSSDRTQMFNNGSQINATIQPGITISGVGLALVEGSAAPIKIVNGGRLTTAFPGNALQLKGDGGLISYTGNGGIISTNTTTNGAVNGGAALDASNTGGGISITTGTGTISGAQGIDASSTLEGAVEISTGSGQITGTVAQGILAATASGSISVTVGSGGVSSTGLGSPAIDAVSSNGSISIIANGTVTGGGFLSDPGTAPPGIIATSNGSGNIVIGGSGTVNGPAGRGIWGDQTTTGLGGILVTGAGDVSGLGAVCPGNVSRQTAISSGEIGCSAIRAEIQNTADNGNITVNRSGTLTGTAAAVDARTVGNGNIVVTTGLNAQLTGKYGFGLEGQTSGTGSISISTAGANSTIVTGGTGILAVNDATAVPASAASTITVNTKGTITSTANPISLRNEKNPLGVLAAVSAGYLGSQAAISNPHVYGSVTVNNAATLNAIAGYGILAYHYGTGSISVTNSAAITAPIGIGLTGSGRVTGLINNSGNINSQSAAIDTSGAGAAVTINQMAGQVSGNILLSPHGDTLNISGGAVSGNIVGNSALNGPLAGTVNFTAVNFTTGGTIDVAAINVNAGTLTLADDVTVFNAFTNNATVELLAGGTRTINGNYSQSGAGTLLLAVGPAGSAQLAVTGVASLAGTLSLNYAPGTYTARNYTLLTAGGGVTGGFSATQETGAVPALARQLGYGPNTVVLVVGAEDGVAAPAAATAGTTAAVVVRPGDEGLFGAQDSTLALLAHRSVAALLGTDDAPACGGPGTFSQTPAASDVAVLPFCRAGGWIQFADSPVQAGSGSTGFSSNTAHILLGVDRPLDGDRIRVGVALGYDQTWLSDNAGGSATGQVMRFGVYGSARLDPVIVSAAVSYGIEQLSTQRETGIGSASASHSGGEVSGGLQARLPIAVSTFTLTPLAGVRFAVLNENGFVESASGPAAGSAVSGGAIGFNTVVPYVRLEVARTFRTADGWEIAPAAQIGYDYEAGNVGPSVSLIANDGTAFTSRSLKLDRSSAVLGGSISVGRSNWQIVAGVHANIAGNWSSQTVEASYHLHF